MGRPSKATPEIEQEVLDRLSAGESLNSICGGDFPVAESTVRKWAIEDVEGFGAKYARARDIGLDCRADRMIADAKAATDAPLGRLAFDADRWYLSKLAPKRYGDKIDVTTAGEAMAPNLVINVIPVKA